MNILADGRKKGLAPRQRKEERRPTFFFFFKTRASGGTCQNPTTEINETNVARFIREVGGGGIYYAKRFGVLTCRTPVLVMEGMREDRSRCEI